MPLSLTLRDPALRSPGRWERWLVWFPIIGWIVGYQMQVSRVRRAIAQVDLQLRERDVFPSEAWSQIGISPEHAEAIAKVIAARVTQRPANHHFAPGDPLHLLLLEDEGMGWVEAAHVVRKHYQIKIPRELLTQSTTFGDLVRLLEGRPVAA